MVNRHSLTKKIFSLMICSILLASMIGCSNNEKTLVSHADYAHFSDQNEIVKFSDLIIVGRVTKINRPEVININADKTRTPYEVVYTVSDIEVLDIIKGSVSGNSIRLKQAGGDYKGIKYVQEGMEYVKKQGEYIFFLDTYDDPNMPYSLVNPSQGMIELNNNIMKIDSAKSAISKGLDKNGLIEQLRVVSSIPQEKFDVDPDLLNQLLNK